MLSARSTTAIGRRKLALFAEVRARWSLDAKFGQKAKATVAMREWMQTIGKRAGMNESNARLSSGAVGVAESRLEVRVGSASDEALMRSRKLNAEHHTVTPWHHFLVPKPNRWK